MSTNTVQVIRETVLQVKRPNQQHQSTEGKVGQPQTGRGSKPTRGFHRVTSEPLKKEKTLLQWVPSEAKHHTAGWPVQVLYRTIDCATTDATQHFSKTSKKHRQYESNKVNNTATKHSLCPGNGVFAHEKCNIFVILYLFLSKTIKTRH